MQIARILITIITVVYFTASSFAQDVLLRYCVKGEKDDILKSTEKFEDNSYLLSIRSNSFTQDFTRSNSNSDSLLQFGSNWLIRINENGDTIWKRKLPNTERALNENVQPSFVSGSFLCFPILDYHHKIQTIATNEILLSYTYADSITVADLTFLSNDYITSKHSYYLDFGVLDINGNYKLYPFSVDSFLIDGSQFYDDKIFTTKINDSIYQLVGNFGRQNTLNIYSVNINTKEVLKNVFDIIDFYGNYHTYIPMSSNNKLYLLNYSATDTISSLIKINASVELEDEIILPNNTSFIAQLLNGNFLLTGINAIDTAGKTSTKAIYSIFNPLTASLITHEFFNNFPDSTFDLVSIQNTLPSETPKDILETVLNYAYFIVREEYGSSNFSFFRNKLIKINPENGNIIWSKPIDSVDYFTNDITGNNLLFHKITNGNKIRNTITKIDSDGIQKWNIQLPDTVRYNQQLVFLNSEIKYHRDVHYDNQFFVSADYIDTSNAISYPVYFFISNNTGTIKRKDFSMINNVADFCNSTNNELLIIGQEENKCDVATQRDVVIYQFNEVLTAIKSNQINAPHNFILYPNPTNNVISVQLNSDNNIKDISISIMDISGKLLYNTIMQEPFPFSINVQDFPSGLYFIQLDANEIHQTQKFQVIH